MSEVARVEWKDKVAVVSLARSTVLNAFDLDMAVKFAEVLGALAVDDGCRAVVVTGEGRAFCSGGDLAWARSHPQGLHAGFHVLAGRLHQSVTEIKRMKKPVIAAINGIAAGAGFSLALACDFRVMDPSAVLKLAYTSIGLSMDGGASFSLPRLVGLARATEIAALDAPIAAEQALAWGLVSRVASAGKALEEAVELAGELAKRSLNSFAWSKQLLNDSFDISLETALERERGALVACADHPDGREGLAAFAEKRSPDFQGKSGSGSD